MAEQKSGRYGLIRAAPAIALAGLVAACAWGPRTPAPVVLKGAPPVVAEPALGPAGAASPRADARRIVVERGQSLSVVAHANHVPAQAIIAANHLTPPYKIEPGQHLLIPGTAAAAMQPPLAAASPVAATPQGRPPPEIIPLDGPPPAKALLSPPSTASLTPPSEAAPAQGPAQGPAQAPPQGPPPGPSAAEEARGEPAAAAPLPRGGRFAWPVRGRVLAGYGVTASGSRNDGINIAAPRGTPVAAVDGGAVAYAGNELRGYGNLVLVKHASGWITAYAHLDEVLVKRGDTVSRGQLIAKVGATGGVSEPQLHFELRRGKQAVDPREFLAPAPSAGKAEQPG
jgi:murein DD-endopeptidase MepM/ murein hydrolase activator NlpD